MTTLEFIYFICDEFEEPCEDGIEFAKNNPNVLNAIDTLLANKSEIQYVRWACWQEKVMGWVKYNEMFNDVISVNHSYDVGVKMLNQKCVEILKKFVVDNNLA
jgi:hypothetical protein